MKNIYFIGIGGIGMSALARYFLHKGHKVAGYDRVQTPLTEELEKEGAHVHYTDDIKKIPTNFLDKNNTLVVYTPAIPSSHSEFQWYKNEGFEMIKRSAILGYIAKDKYVMAVAGTHGKTTTTTMLSWLNNAVTKGKAYAFLGGISKNFNSNFVVGDGDSLAIEADEFDRSYLQLYPNVAIITSADADHLDIYGTHKAVKQAFSDFISQIKPGGYLILRKGVELEINNSEIKIFSYSYDEEADFFVRNVTINKCGYPTFDLVCPDMVIEDCELGLPGVINIENAVAAVAAIWTQGIENSDVIKTALKEFNGVKRRFDIYLNTESQIYMDDYAHHPRELTAAINSVRNMFANRKITAIFQPHLFTRTRDFHIEFAEALSLADRVLLLPIYPARELPIEGVTCKMIGKNITKELIYLEKSEIIAKLDEIDTDITISFGAGDIDQYCLEINNILSQKLQKDGKS